MEVEFRKYFYFRLGTPSLAIWIEVGCCWLLNFGTDISKPILKRV